MEIVLDGQFPDTFPIDRVVDTFSRSDGPVGSTEIGKVPWQLEASANVSDWRAEVRSNALSVFRASAAPASQRGYATVNTGKSDGTVSGRIVVAPGGIESQSAIMVFRYVNPDNHLMVLVPSGGNMWALYKRVNGNGTLIATGEVIAIAGQTLDVSMAGTGIVIRADGVPAVRRVDVPEFANATRHGFGSYVAAAGTGGAVRFDDFKHIGG